MLIWFNVYCFFTFYQLVHSASKIVFFKNLDLFWVTLKNCLTENWQHSGSGSMNVWFIWCVYYFSGLRQVCRQWDKMGIWWCWCWSFIFSLTVSHLIPCNLTNLCLSFNYFLNFSTFSVFLSMFFFVEQWIIVTFCSCRPASEIKSESRHSFQSNSGFAFLLVFKKRSFCYKSVWYEIFD